MTERYLRNMPAPDEAAWTADAYLRTSSKLVPHVRALGQAGWEYFIFSLAQPQLPPCSLQAHTWLSTLALSYCALGGASMIAGHRIQFHVAPPLNSQPLHPISVGEAVILRAAMCSLSCEGVWQTLMLAKHVCTTGACLCCPCPVSLLKWPCKSGSHSAPIFSNHVRRVCQTRMLCSPACCPQLSMGT